MISSRLIPSLIAFFDYICTIFIRFSSGKKMMVTVMVAVVVIYRGTIYMKKALRKRKKERKM